MPRISIVMPFRNAAATLPEALAVSRRNVIPHARGLGSSSAAIVAGFAAGDGRV